MVKIPENYTPSLGLYETQKAIGLIKNVFLVKICAALHLKRVTAPLFVDPSTGLNDDLNGVERPVEFDIPAVGGNAQVVHSLAKWKRLALHDYGFYVGNGLVADMNAIRRDEELDNLHSIYVDQWDWEKVIDRDTRNMAYLEDTVRRIVSAICGTLDELKWQFGRAPDYDDWSMNGDLLFWHEPLGMALEISSMGIRVDENSLAAQLKIAGCEARAELPFHKMLLNGELPLTIGGGIGQSRLCMLLLGKVHIGEVQASLWDEETRRVCAEKGVILL